MNILEVYLNYLYNEQWTPFSPDVLGSTGQKIMDVASGPVGTAATVGAVGAIAARAAYKQLKKNKCLKYKKDPVKYRQCVKGR